MQVHVFVSYLELLIGVTLRFLAPAGFLLPTLRVLRGYTFISVNLLKQLRQ